MLGHFNVAVSLSFKLDSIYSCEQCCHRNTKRTFSLHHCAEGLTQIALIVHCYPSYNKWDILGSKFLAPMHEIRILFPTYLAQFNSEPWILHPDVVLLHSLSHSDPTHPGPSWARSLPHIPQSVAQKPVLAVLWRVCSVISFVLSSPRLHSAPPQLSAFSGLCTPQSRCFLCSNHRDASGMHMTVSHSSLLKSLPCLCIKFHMKVNSFSCATWLLRLPLWVQVWQVHVSSCSRNLFLLCFLAVLSLPLSVDFCNRQECSFLKPSWVVPLSLQFMSLLRVLTTNILSFLLYIIQHWVLSNTFTQLLLFHCYISAWSLKSSSYSRVNKWKRK